LKLGASRDKAGKVHFQSVPNIPRPELTGLSPEERAEVERQRAEVRKQYEGTDKWLKAPNGKESKLVQAARDLGLPEDQLWLAVRTPFFKAWFGDWEKEGHPVSGHTSEDIAPFTSDLASQTSAVATGGSKYSTEENKSQGYLLDENGEPLLINHGTDEEFDNFDKKKSVNYSQFSGI